MSHVPGSKSPVDGVHRMHLRQGSNPMAIPEMLARGLLERGESLGINKTVMNAVSELKVGDINQYLIYNANSTIAKSTGSRKLFTAASHIALCDECFLPSPRRETSFGATTVGASHAIRDGEGRHRLEGCPATFRRLSQLDCGHTPS